MGGGGGVICIEFELPMLVRSLPMKSRKRPVCDVLDTAVTNVGLICDVTEPNYPSSQLLCVHFSFRFHP